MASATVIWIILSSFTAITSSQILREYNTSVLPNQGICLSKVYQNNAQAFYNTYKDCVVILGNLQLTIMERSKREDFLNMSLPNLKEVTGFVVVYRVKGLQSLGQLFPNLARIRGEELLNNYGLIVYDLSSLKEVGLYGLLKIDRGGVIVWGVPKACFADTVDWQTIAPRSRHVIDPERLLAHCEFPCRCTLDRAYNHCWNNRKCQIYLEGPEALPCHEQCLGCRNTNSTQCSLCKDFTYNGFCVPKCPSNTIILPQTQYCISRAECKNLTGFVWNNTCLFECPIHYVKEKGTKGPTCRLCVNCDKTCPDLFIQSVSSMQAAGHCVYVNGSLTIHVRAVTEAMDELRTHLSRIQEVTDYIHIHGSLTISSLDFLSSLRIIRGRKLYKDAYSLIMYEMSNLQKLFTENVTEKLTVERGTIKMIDNPMLCIREIEKLLPRFPVQPIEDVDLPVGRNGYSGGCQEVSAELQIRAINETFALVMFSTEDLNIHYTVLYVRLPPGVHQSVIPETCSEHEWNAIDANPSYGNTFAVVQLTPLRPASTYAVCLETYNPYHNTLARSVIYNFTTPVGVPEPPFIHELTAANSEAVVIHWVDHREYSPHVVRYDLEVSLVEIKEEHVAVKDQCEHVESHEIDKTRHAAVWRPPIEYDRGCESMCGVLSSVTEGAMVEEFFDVCSEVDCNISEEPVSVNTSFGKYVKTFVVYLEAPRNQSFRIGNLAPYRDYRFRLRACTDFACSRFSSSFVKTLAMTDADVPVLQYAVVDSTGYITVKWDPPEVSNGPILSYLVQVLPRIHSSYDGGFQSWCVPAAETYSIVKSVKAEVYLVRVCARSMAFDSICSEYETIVHFTPSWWKVSFIFGLLIYIVCISVGYLTNRQKADDMAPIVDYMSTLSNESEPPAKMFSNFVYTVPLRESKLE